MTRSRWVRPLLAAAIVAGPVSAAEPEKLCGGLAALAAAGDLKALAGEMEHFNATKPARVDGMDFDGGQYTKWAATRRLPGFDDCTVNEYVTIRLSGARIADPVIYNCTRPVIGDRATAEAEFAAAAGAVHACLPGASRRDDTPKESMRAWAGERRAFVEWNGRTIVVSYGRPEKAAGDGYRLNVDISRK